jgi:hypothetical protein
MMRNHERHLSDEELVLAADDHPGRRADSARAHLEDCGRCRSRAAEFENTIARLAQARRRILDPKLPSIAIPRATLRARMSEIAAREAKVPSRFPIPSRLFAGAFGVASLVIAIAAAGILTFRHSDPQDQYWPPMSSDLGVLPNHDFTPGVVRPASFQEICALPHEEVVKEVSPAQRETVLEEYGIPNAQSNEFEVDYLITPGLGGKDDIRNLWPEPYHTATWNAYVKDALEERLHEMVCSHQLDLAVAQRAIATNWIAAYRKYVQPSTAKTRMDGAFSLTTALRSIDFSKDADAAQSLAIPDRRRPAILEGTRHRRDWPRNAES